MSFLVNPYVFVRVLELARDTTAYQDLTNLTTYTSDARAIGTASATRRVYALLTGFTAGATGRTLASGTIGGVAFTIDKQVTASGNGSSVVCAIASADVPTGTTAVVAATFSGGMQAFQCSVIALDNLLSSTPTDTASGSDVVSSPITVNTGANQDFPLAGYVMGVAAGLGDSNSGGITWTNLTETVDVFENTENLWFGAAYAQPGSAQSGVTVTADFAQGAGGTSNVAIATVAVR